MGVKIADASSVAVTTQAVSSRLAFEQLGQLRLDRHDEREHERRGQARERQHGDDRALVGHPREAPSLVLFA